MLDELLGRSELKARIDDLEEAQRRLRERLAGEERRRADAVAARQDAEERENRLTDRIAELEDRVERAEGDSAPLAFRGTEDCRGDRLAAVLDRLRSFETGPEGALTAMVGDGGLPQAAREAFGDRAALVARAAPCLVVTDDAGLVCVALDPPLAPDPFVEWADGFRLDPAWFRPTGSFAVALVRSDLFALGEYEGAARVAFTGFETDVQAKHSKGGFSQARFERRRDAQIDAHLERCAAALDDRDADRLFVLGERTLLPEFEADANHTAPVDATGDPESALDEAVRSFFTTRLYRL